MYDVLWKDTRGIQHYINYKNRADMLKAVKNTRKYIFVCCIDYSNKRIIKDREEL